MHTNLQLPAEMNHWARENRYSQESNALDLLAGDVLFPEQINYLGNVKACLKADLFMVNIPPQKNL